MPSVLREHQHEMLDLDSGLTGFVFGTEDTGYLTLSRPVVVAGDVRSADVDRPSEDGRAFGRDFLGSKSYTFEIGVLTDATNGLGTADPHAANLDALNALDALWNDPKWRNNPRSMAMLRSCEAGRTWRCYGRPRRFDEAAGKLTYSGYTPVVAGFDLIDDRWYADVESFADVNLAPSPTGGFTAPLVAPITTTYDASGVGVAVIGGSKATWPVVEFHGPILNPSVTIGDLTIGLTGALAYDHIVTVDTRPWRRLVRRNTDGASLSGWLSAATPVMRACLLPVGTHDVTLRGADVTGSSWVRVRWREARARP